MKILFINPCLRPGAAVKFPPVGLAYIMHAVKKAGYDFDFLDLDLHEMNESELDRALAREQYDVVGIGCIVTGLSEVVRITDAVRRASPNAVIIAGNSVATSIPEMLLRNTVVNIAVLGEGDETIVDLLNALVKRHDWRTVSGIAFLHEGAFIKTAPRPHIPHLDAIGFPDWNMFDIEAYNSVSMKHDEDVSERARRFPLNGARGCLFNCTFCYHVFKTAPYRKYSEQAVMEEFRRLSQEYDATFISFWDELTFPNAASAERMAVALEALPFRTPWQATTRGNLFSNEHVALVRRLKEAGCKSIAFSIENASPEILAAMNKKINHKLTVEHANALHHGGVTPYTSIIFGYPQETPKTIRATLDLCEECGIYPSAGYLMPLPGTPIYEQAKHMGVIKDEWSYLLQAGDRQDFYVNMTTMPDDEFVHSVESGMRELAGRLGLHFDNPMKTGVYRKKKIGCGAS